ncbi:MAG: twin-arginine translocation signal domain-containing protein [Pseudomonadota bacterium]
MSDTDVKSGRRDFLKLAGVAAVTGGTALAAQGSDVEAAEVGKDAGGYRETEHVRTYYDSARF